MNIQGISIKYLILINIVTFAVYAVDKRRAIKDEYRISESTLLGLAAVGGSLGALCAMQICHHKTRKKKFSVGVPILLALQFALLTYLGIV